MPAASGPYAVLRGRINFILTALVVYDIVLSGVCLIRPDLWFRYIHGVGAVDPQGLILRTGAVWAAFSVFQILARLKWEVQPLWLAVIAGIRLTEVFSDWTYVYVAADLTAFGRIALLVNPPMNAFLGWYFIRAFRRVHVELDPELRIEKGATHV
jgi:hypothetical protein